MIISLSMPDDLISELKDEANRNHRSVSGQVAFFCEQCLLNTHKQGEIRSEKEVENAD